MSDCESLVMGWFNVTQDSRVHEPSLRRRRMFQDSSVEDLTIGQNATGNHRQAGSILLSLSVRLCHKMKSKSLRCYK